jgi:hypothetical protein
MEVFFIIMFAKCFKVALGQVYFEYFGFSYQSFHQFRHHHNNPGLAQ